EFFETVPGRAQRMYPTMVSTPSAPAAASQSATDASPPAADKSLTSARDGDGSLVPQTQPDGSIVWVKPAHAATHPHDLAARRYPKGEQPDPVAQAIADKINGEPVEHVENVPANIAKLREGDPLRYGGHYDQAMGLRTKD